MKIMDIEDWNRKMCSVIIITFFFFWSRVQSKQIKFIWDVM